MVPAATDVVKSQLLFSSMDLLINNFFTDRLIVMLLTFNDTFVFLTLTSKDKVVVTTGWFLCRRRVQYVDSFFSR